MAKSAYKSSKSILNQFKESESSASIVFGAIVVVVVGILLFNYSRSNRLALLSEKGATTEVPGQQGSSVTLPATYTVTEGDHLWRIAEKFYGSGYNWVDIAEANQLTDADGLRIGMTLTIPVATAKTLTAAKQTVMDTPTTELISESTYQVQAGDSLWKIAVRAYGDGYKWTSILNANRALITDANVIHAGWMINLPR